MEKEVFEWERVPLKTRNLLQKVCLIAVIEIKYDIYTKNINISPIKATERRIDKIYILRYNFVRLRTIFKR